MATPAQIVVDQANRDQERREVLQDREREDQEHLLATAAANSQITLSQAAQGMDALYAHEPVSQRFKRLGTFLEGIVGKKPKGQAQSQYPAPSVTTTTGAITNPDTGQTAGGAPVTVKGPAPRNGQQYASQILSGAKSQEQVYADKLAAQSKAKMDATRQQSDFDRQQAEQNAKDFAATYKRITGKDPSPDMLQAFTVSAFGGDKVLSTMEQTNALKAREDYQNSTLQLRQAQQTLNQAKFDASQNPSNPAFQLKLRQAQVAAERAQSYWVSAQARAYGSVNGVPLPGAMVDSDGNPIGAEFQSNVRPTGTQRERATLATSARDQLADADAILKRRGDLFGPGAGQVTSLRQWLGTADPDAQAYRAAVVTAADHLMGVFGGRSTYAGQKISALMDSFAQNPDAAIAALRQYDKAAKLLQGVGSYSTVGGGMPSPTGSTPATPKGLAPRKQSKPPGGNQYRFTATNPQTGQKIGSNDQRTWYDLKTGKQVAQ